jgi:hypothetical protein
MLLVAEPNDFGRPSMGYRWQAAEVGAFATALFGRCPIVEAVPRENRFQRLGSFEFCLCSRQRRQSEHRVTFRAGQKWHRPCPRRAARRSRQLGAALGGRPSSSSELDPHSFREAGIY